MSIDEMKMAALFCFALAGALLIFSGVIFFIWDIRKIVGDMTGFNARKAIRKFRQQNKGAEFMSEVEPFFEEKTEQLGDGTEILMEETSLLEEKTSFYLLEEKSFFASEKMIDM